MRQVWITLLTGVVRVLAAEVVYVTDLEIFTYLAPCAASAVSYNVLGLTYSDCPQAVTALQSCVCTKNNNLASVSTALSSSVSYSCGSTATDDLASAYTVLNAYCNQDSTVAFPTPTNPVTAYITDLPYFADLAPCAASAVSSAVQGMTWSECPQEATLLAPCVCSRNQNSLKASQIINTSAKESCSSHSADISSAQALFSAYCAMNDGTTSLPTTSKPPGDMTYYITALTQYSSLAPCAQSAVQSALTYAPGYLCPSGPQALASCACIKPSMSTYISSDISTNVKYYCESTASEDISSALSVFDFYCSAALGSVVAAGVTESIDEPSGTDTAFSGSGQTGSAGSRGGGLGSALPTKTKLPMIIGAVCGGIALLVIAGVAAFFILKRRKAVAANSYATINAQPQTGPGGPAEFFGKAELSGTEIQPSQSPFAGAPPTPASPSPNTIGLASNRMDNVSPVSAHSSHYAAPPSELPGKGNISPVPPVPAVPELQGGMMYKPPSSPYQTYNYAAPPQSRDGTPVYEAPGMPAPPAPVAQGQQPYPTQQQYAPQGQFQGQQQYPGQVPYGQQLYGQPMPGQGGYPGQPFHPVQPPVAELSSPAYVQGQGHFVAELPADGSRGAPR